MQEIRFDDIEALDGARPADTTQLGFPTGLEVALVGGDQVARYTGGGTGTYDQLEQSPADPFVTAFITAQRAIHA